MVKILLVFLLLVAPARGSYVIQSGGGSSPSTTTVYDYSSAAQFTFTAAELEVQSGGISLENNYTGTGVFVATYSSSKNANYSKYGGNLIATSTGNSAITADYLVFSDAAAARVCYNIMNNFPMGNVYTIKFKLKPGYTGNPGAQQNFFVTARNGGDFNWVTSLRQEAETNIRWTASDDSVTKSGAPAWSPTSGQEYEIELNVNFVGGAYRLFIDGVQQGATVTGTGDRTGLGAFMCIGQDTQYAAGHIANFSIRDLIIYESTGHTSDYTPGYTLNETAYLTTNPAVIATNGVTVSSFVSASFGSIATGADGVKCQIQVGGTNKYWNGAAWANSDGTYSQANTSADIATNIATLSGGSVKPRCLLHSDNGITTPTLTNFTLVYN